MFKLIVETLTAETYSDQRLGCFLPQNIPTNGVYAFAMVKHIHRYNLVYMPVLYVSTHTQFRAI